MPKFDCFQRKSTIWSGPSLSTPLSVVPCLQFASALPWSPSSSALKGSLCLCCSMDFPGFGVFAFISIWPDQLLEQKLDCSALSVPSAFLSTWRKYLVYWIAPLLTRSTVFFPSANSVDSQVEMTEFLINFFVDFQLFTFCLMLKHFIELQFPFYRKTFS